MTWVLLLVFYSTLNTTYISIPTETQGLCENARAVYLADMNNTSGRLAAHTTAICLHTREHPSQ